MCVGCVQHHIGERGRAVRRLQGEAGRLRSSLSAEVSRSFSSARRHVFRGSDLSVPCSRRAARAQSSGLFEQEIVPVATKIVDADGTERAVTVAKDEGIRVGTSLAGLGKLRPAFTADGSTTAGGCRDAAAAGRRVPPSQSLTCALSQVTPAR